MQSDYEINAKIRIAVLEIGQMKIWKNADKP